MALFGKRRGRPGGGGGSGYQDTYPWWMFWQSNQPDSAVGGQQAQDEGPTMAQPDGGQANPEGETVGEAKWAALRELEQRRGWRRLRGRKRRRLRRGERRRRGRLAAVSPGAAQARSRGRVRQVGPPSPLTDSSAPL